MHFHEVAGRKERMSEGGIWIVHPDEEVCTHRVEVSDP